VYKYNIGQEYYATGEGNIHEQQEESRLPDLTLKCKN
jgi:hypothetical protein